MTTTTVLATWANITETQIDPYTDVVTALGEWGGDFDVDQVVTDWIGALNAKLPEELHLARNGEVYGPAGYEPELAVQSVHEAMDDVDFWAVAGAHDKALDPAEEDHG